jgi:hypothetical protein
MIGEIKLFTLINLILLAIQYAFPKINQKDKVRYWDLVLQMEELG